MSGVAANGSVFWSPYYEEPRPAEPLWWVDGHLIVRCCDSGLIYMAHPLTDAELAAFYSREYFEGEPSRRGYASYTGDEAVLRANFRDHLRRITRGLERGGARPDRLDLLDYGCAYGYFLAEARDVFRSVRGVEINEEVARVGRERFQLDIDSSADSGASFGENCLDVVTLWDVIEHVKKPRSVFNACHRALRQSGRIYVSTGDVGSLHARLLGKRWRLVNPPQHISYFSAASLTGLLEECGFKVIERRYYGRRVSLGFIFFILRYLAGRKVNEAPDVSSRLLRASIPLNLFDVMTVSAVKKEERRSF